MHLEDSPQWRAAKGESFEMEFGVTDKGPRRRWFEAIGNPLAVSLGENHGHGGGLVLIREITDRREGR